ncbi:hypothetical protein WJX72_002126 [[Myrmecia] bisecta]|uniref:Mediator complex subunit 17 n=1 Tax=[Myrmecia] bisecta TaxID=41462 RepID=A0AAW1P9Z5_9CHLO
MAFAMSLPRTKRVKYIEENGREEFVTDDRWAFLRAADPALQAGNVDAEAPASEAKEEGKATEAGPKLPWEVLEKIHTARGEIDVILDLVNYVEAQQHVGVVAVQRSTKLSDLTNERALRLQAKTKQIQDATQRLRRGADALRSHIKRESGFFENVARLQSHWKIRRAPHGGPNSYYVDIALPLKQPWLPHLRQDGHIVDIMQDERRDMYVVDDAAPTDANGRQPVIRGVDAIHVFLERRQRQLLWRLVQQTLDHESEALASGSFADSLASKLVAKVQQSRSIELVWRALTAQAKDYPGSSMHWVLTGKDTTSAIRINVGSAHSMLLIINRDTLKFDGVPPHGPANLRWSGDTMYVVPKQEISTLLHSLLKAGS